MEEICEVNFNKDIKEMDIFDFTQDTLATPATLKKLSVISIPTYHPAPNKNNLQKKNLTLKP